jgi:hypothetical protein
MTVEPQPLPQPKRMGRPRLDSPERRRRVLASKAKWRDANREYYRAQIKQRSSRPEYKARRRERRANARAARAHEEQEALGWDNDLEYDEALHCLVPRGASDAIILPPGYTLWDYIAPQGNATGGDSSSSD